MIEILLKSKTARMNDSVQNTRSVLCRSQLAEFMVSLCFWCCMLYLSLYCFDLHNCFLSPTNPVILIMKRSCLIISYKQRGFASFLMPVIKKRKTWPVFELCVYQRMIKVGKDSKV